MQRTSCVPAYRSSKFSRWILQSKMGTCLFNVVSGVVSRRAVRDRGGCAAHVDWVGGPQRSRHVAPASGLASFATHLQR